ncbi:MAG: DinB family protein [Candidatus Thermofonsia Clade 1 bacterium]|uniref:DinB family protein n=1 Tax=Candidatus Thermofonsia Clade 1 bacterium TaxID=2364210 RepID=A0A2M8P3Q0_9CHLR|nr:MAG: DinB family protein [Candidatus Thermofonsia Clade 1 bacterium]
MENLTMLIDFTPVREGSLKLLEFAQRFTFHDLRLAVNAYIDATLDLLADCDDAMLTFEPHDPEAHDPFAPEADQHIGWNLAHLVLHVTASLEEGAAFCSILGRGVPVGGRLRYEPDWRMFTRREQVIGRLEESRRMCLAYLDTLPEPPHLDIFREMPEQYVVFFGQLNAPANLLLGLLHWDDHMAQMREAKAQAHAALKA